MSKYEPLGQFLRRQQRERVPMTFVEIERVLNGKLPASKRHRAWWSNNPDNNVMTREWLGAGFETELVDIESGKLVFRRVARTAGPSSHASSIFGCMKGMVTIVAGHDLTAPTGDDWSSVEIGGLHKP
jgi:hypothetical protein